MTFSNVCFNGSLNLFVTLPTLTLESNQIWHFQGPRSRDLTTGYANIWVGDKVLQSRTFSLERLIVMFVMTFRDTWFDYKLLNFRSLKLNFVMNCYELHELWIVMNYMTKCFDNKLVILRYPPTCWNMQPNKSS